MNRDAPQWLWACAALACVAVVGALDWLTGDELSFFVFYFLPVSIAAWLIGWRISLAVAMVAALVWSAVDSLSGHIHASHFYAVWDAMARFAALAVNGGSLSRIRKLLDRQTQLVEELERTLSEVKVLEAFLPICCECKKIRDADGRWQQL